MISSKQRQKVPWKFLTLSFAENITLRPGLFMGACLQYLNDMILVVFLLEGHCRYGLRKYAR